MDTKKWIAQLHLYQTQWTFKEIISAALFSLPSVKGVLVKIKGKKVFCPTHNAVRVVIIVTNTSTEKKSYEHVKQALPSIQTV